MRISKFFIFLPVVVIFALQAKAQTVRSGREVKHARVVFEEVARYYKDHPLPETRRPLFDEDEESRPERETVDASLVHLYVPNGRSASSRLQTPDLPVSPAPNDTFESTVSNHTGIPPDTHGAVDSMYCVTAINTAIHIQSRSGFNFSDVSLDGFWAPLLVHGPGSFDPRVHFDEFNKRWIMAVDAYGETTYSMFFVAVSETENPLGAWNMYSFTPDPSGAAWMDFPNVGYNNKWVSVTGNMFPNSGFGGGAVVCLIDYAGMRAGVSAPYTQFSEPTSFSICPALTYDATEGNLFMVESWDNTTGKLKLWKASGPVGSPVLTTIGYPATSTHWASNAPGGADFLPQVGSTYKMDAGDDRITSLTFRNNKLWCSHTVFLPASGVTHSSVMWWQLDTTAHPLQNGMINDATAAISYAYSSIAVNANEDFLIGCGYFSHAVHASGGYALHLNSDPADSIRPVVVYRHGQASYYETFGGGRDRWGDYSATCLDPRNDTDFWTLQETTVVGTSPNWDTWWANVQFCPKPSQPTLAFTPAAPCSGDSVLYVINPVDGATSYVWTVSGSGWTGSSTSDSIYITAGTGTGTVTVLAYNACGEGENRVITIVPHALPPRPYLTVYSPACVGSPTAIFVASATGATGFSWVALDSGWSGSSTATSITANVGTGTGMIICTASNICGAGPSDTMYVTPTPMPSLPLVVSGGPYCMGTTSASFTATSTGATSYSWLAIDSGWSGTGTGSVFAPTVGTGTGTIICSGANQCGNGPSDTFTVSLLPLPIASFTESLHVVGLLHPDTITYNGTAMSTGSYTWNFGGGVATPGSGAGPQYVHWASIGHKTVTLTVTDSHGCTSPAFSDTVLVVDTIPFKVVNVYEQSIQVNISPNPNEGAFDVVFSKPIYGTVWCRFADMQGREVLATQQELSGGSTIKINLGPVVPGIYTATIELNGVLSNIKVNVMK
jgi:PKD-like domain